MAQLDIVYVSFTAITTKYGLKHLAKHNLVNSVSQLFYCNPLNLPYIKHWIIIPAVPTLPEGNVAGHQPSLKKLKYFKIYFILEKKHD